MTQEFYSVVINNNIKMSKIDSCWECLFDAKKRKRYLEDLYRLHKENLYKSVEIHKSSLVEEAL